jgi:hypothetical protein
MPKYSVSEILDIIRSLTPKEKQELSEHIPEVLSVSDEFTAPRKTQTQSQNLGNVTISGNGIAADLGQKQVMGGTLSSPQLVAQAQDPVFQEALRELETLSQLVINNQDLDPLHKATTQAQIQVVTDELKKPEPDKGLVGRTIAVLKQGLEGVIALADPVIKVANLVAKAWGIPIP